MSKTSAKASSSGRHHHQPECPLTWEDLAILSRASPEMVQNRRSVRITDEQAMALHRVASDAVGQSVRTLRGYPCWYSVRQMEEAVRSLRVQLHNYWAFRDVQGERDLTYEYRGWLIRRHPERGWKERYVAVRHGIQGTGLIDRLEAESDATIQRAIDVTLEREAELQEMAVRASAS